MKNDIHPKYNNETKVSCACGRTFTTGSVQDEIKTELCSACHPFYTGKQKLIDTERRAEKFHAKIAKKATGDLRTKKTKLVAKSEARKEKKTEKAA